MNNEFGVLVNLPLPLPQPSALAALEEGPPGSWPDGPLDLRPACLSASLGLAFQNAES